MDEEQVRKIARSEIKKIMNAGRRTDLVGKLPGIEFEGPMGWFWTDDEVPIDAIAIGVLELIEEAQRRGFNLDMLTKIAKERRTRLRLDKK